MMKPDSHKRERFSVHRPRRSGPALAVPVLLLLIGGLLDITDASSRRPPSRTRGQAAKTYWRQESSAQFTGASATLPAGLALDACGTPFIADIEKFLDTCPATDPATPEILNDFQIRRNGSLAGEIPCSEPISQLPVAQYTDELIALQGLRVIYYMDRGKSGHLPWTPGTLYDWMKSRISGIDIRDGINPFCCEQFDGKTYIAVSSHPDSGRDAPFRKWENISILIHVYAHETRHVDGFGHTSCCGIPGGCDQTYDESNLSPYGAQWWLCKCWLLGDINVGISCLSESRIQEITSVYLGMLDSFSQRFCDNKPPVVTIPAVPGGQCPATAPDFEFSVSPEVQILQPGDSASFNVEVRQGPNDQSPGTVRLCSTVTPLDSKITVTVSPESVGAGTSATLMVTTGSDILPGTYPIGIGGTSGLHVQTKTATVTITGLLITSAEVIGKRLYVHGANFDEGAKLFLNGEKQKRAFDEGDPTTVLIGKNAGKWIAPGQTVVLQVRNSDGRLSNRFMFTRPIE